VVFGGERRFGWLAGWQKRTAQGLNFALLAPDQKVTKEFATGKNAKAPEGTATGATAGRAIGGMIGLLAGVGAGAAAGGLIGALAGMGDARKMKRSGTRAAG